MYNTLARLLMKGGRMRSATCFPICFALAAAASLCLAPSLHALAAAGAFSFVGG